MTFAQNSRSGLAIGVESAFGTPVTNLTSLPFKTHSLGMQKSRVQGNDILPDRMQRTDRHGNIQALGDIVVDLRDGEYDDLIESAMFSAFDTSGVIKIGTTAKWHTIEDSAEDITQYRQFTSMGVSQMSMSVAPDQMIETTFTMAGQTMTNSATPLDATPTASVGNDPFDSYSGSVTVGGSGANMTALNFSVNNSLNPAFAIGSDMTPQMEYGQAVIEGQGTFYYESAAIPNLFVDETESTIVLAITDPSASSTYTFTFPRVKWNSAPVPVSGPNGSRFVTMDFVALYDATEDTSLKIVKS